MTPTDTQTTEQQSLAELLTNSSAATKMRVALELVERYERTAASNAYKGLVDDKENGGPELEKVSGKLNFETSFGDLKKKSDEIILSYNRFASVYNNCRDNVIKMLIAKGHDPIRSQQYIEKLPLAVQVLEERLGTTSNGNGNNGNGHRLRANYL